MSAAETPEAGGLPNVRITKGAPTEEDLAALAGILPAAYAEEAASATADEPEARSAWNRSRRLRRLPSGRWGRFAG